MKIMNSIKKGVSHLAAALLALVGVDSLKNTAGAVVGQAIKDAAGRTTLDERRAEGIINELRGVKPELKDLLFDVRSEIERDYRRFVDRREGSERHLCEARASKVKKDHALLAIGQAGKVEDDFPTGNKAAKALFRGTDPEKDDDFNKKKLYRNLMSVGTDRRIAGLTSKFVDFAGDTWRTLIKPGANISAAAGAVVAKEVSGTATALSK